MGERQQMVNSSPTGNGKHFGGRGWDRAAFGGVAKASGASRAEPPEAARWAWIGVAEICRYAANMIEKKFMLNGDAWLLPCVVALPFAKQRDASRSASKVNSMSRAMN